MRREGVVLLGWGSVVVRTLCCGFLLVALADLRSLFGFGVLLASDLVSGIRFCSMTEDAKRKVRTDLRKAQTAFERAQRQRDKASVARRESFERARSAGFSMRDIGKETGLHFSRVAEILRGE
jgi:hypothetical protein